MDKKEWCVVVLFDAVCGVLALCATAVSVRSLLWCICIISKVYLVCVCLVCVCCMCVGFWERGVCVCVKQVCMNAWPRAKTRARAMEEKKKKKGGGKGGVVRVPLVGCGLVVVVV